MDKRLMTPEQLSAICARADDKRLPPAPWLWHYYSQYRDDDRGTLHAPCTPSIIAGDVDEVTGQFLAHARADIPALLDEVRRLQGQVVALAGLVGNINTGIRRLPDDGWANVIDKSLTAILNGAGNESEGA